MKKKHLLRLIEELENRVTELEQRPPIYYPNWPYSPPAPWQPSTPIYGTGTGDPMPEPSKIWCSADGECGAHG